MKGDFHVRFCENAGVKFPCVTRLCNIMKNLTLILVIVLQILDVYCQDIDNKIIWVGSSRIYNYEADGRMNADTNEFLSSVLWFSENEINIISFITDYDKHTTVSDTMTFEYSIEDGKIVGNIKNDTVVLDGIIDNIILRINIGVKKTNIDLTFIKLEREIHTNKNDLNEIKRLLTSEKWKIHVSGVDFYGSVI